MGDTPTRAARTATTLPRVRDLAALLGASRTSGQVVVMLFSLPGCPWCEALRRQQLVHLLREARERRVAVVELDITDRTPFESSSGPAPADRAAGAPTDQPTPAALAASLRISMAPTVVFLGGQGELAERLVGYASSDFYGAYLDQRIEQAHERLRSSSGAR